MKNVQQLFFVCAVTALMFAQGCSSIGKPYSEINPEDAKARVKEHNGYHELKSVSPDKTKLVVRSVGAPDAVKFSICKSTTSCEQYEDLGVVRNKGNAVLLPWIAKMTNSLSGGKEFIAVEVPSDQKISVKSLGTIQSPPGSVIMTTDECGPFNVTIPTQKGRNYLVEFQWSGNSCKQTVWDATDPDNPVLIESQQPTT